MSNPRSASNSWAKIRNKLNVATADGVAAATPKKSPQKKKKAVATKAEKSDDDVDGEPESK